jgi:hypothetical protein
LRYVLLLGEILISLGFISVGISFVTNVLVDKLVGIIIDIIAIALGVDLTAKELKKDK